MTLEETVKTALTYPLLPKVGELLRVQGLLTPLCIGLLVFYGVYEKWNEKTQNKELRKEVLTFLRYVSLGIPVVVALVAARPEQDANFLVFGTALVVAYYVRDLLEKMFNDKFFP